VGGGEDDPSAYKDPTGDKSVWGSFVDADSACAIRELRRLEGSFTGGHSEQKKPTKKKTTHTKENLQSLRRADLRS